jgi:beta-glucosidase
VPFAPRPFIANLSAAVQQGDVPIARIDDAVRRILRAKFALGLFEQPTSHTALRAMVGSDDHRAIAREAVAKSLVLLQNDHQALPIAKDTPTILVAGRGADDIGMMCGGWTITWQGRPGNTISGGTTILAGLKAAASGSRVAYDPDGNFEDFKDASGAALKAQVGVVVVGEMPYAEGAGDRADLSLSSADRQLIERMRARSEKLIVILLSGRPMIITGLLDQADAWVAAWLPGTEGQGVTDVLFGDLPFRGKLPYRWPASMDQVPLDAASPPEDGPDALFPLAYGLTP